MSKLNQVEVDKIAALEQAVINDTPDQVSKLYKELGEVICTAHILGLACRMRGLEMVKVLVENGASFRYDNETIQYVVLGEIHLGAISKSSLPDLFTSFLFPDINQITVYPLCEYLMALTDREGNALKPVCEKALIQVVAYLCDNAEKVCFHPGDLLYFSILMDEQNMTAVLKGRGVTISDEKKKMLTEGGGDNAWYIYCYFVQCLKGDDFMRIMSSLLFEVGRDKKLHFTESFYGACCCYGKFFIPENFQFIMEHFNQSKMKKTKLLKEIINHENVSCLAIAANEGWLKIPRKRDEMIQYAMDNNKTECTAFLLEFKNRTADLAAEQEKAEKKLMCELNMSPDSMAAFKKIWSWRKREDGTLIITNYKGTSTTVTVPEKIGKYLVTAIGDGAFAGTYTAEKIRMSQHSKIVKIILPDTLQYIGSRAFYCMLALEEINIPEGVTEIARYAFANCRALKNVMIPRGVREIGEYAFWCCVSLKSITIPDTVEKIGRDIFAICAKLEEVHIGAGVKEIGESTFACCNALKNITIPDTVEKIGEYAFSNCNGLEQVWIGKGVKEIDAYAFHNCIALKTVTIPGTVEKIRAYAFVNNLQLEEVCIGAGVKEIGDSAFQSCRVLKTVTIPDTVEKIGKYAFADGYALEEVCICGNVMKISIHAFKSCFNLKDIIVQKSIPNRILGEIFENRPKLLVHCPKGSKTEAYCKKKGISQLILRNP